MITRRTLFPCLLVLTIITVLTVGNDLVQMDRQQWQPILPGNTQFI